MKFWIGFDCRDEDDIIISIFALLIIFQVKHFVADYLLQGRYMLGKFKGGTEWILPLTAHCSVHAIGTFLRKAFYAGWVSCFSVMTDIPSKISDDESCLIFDDIQKQLFRFGLEFELEIKRWEKNGDA